MKPNTENKPGTGLSKPSQSKMIRKASVHDVKEIHGLLSQHAEHGELLPRPLSDLYEHIRDFSIFQEDAGGVLVGTCALHVCWEDLAEIRSLAVRQDHWRQGIGSALVACTLAEARSIGIKRVFTLTYKPDFFAMHGFEVVDKALLPQKIWADCIKCVKFPDCDETAMVTMCDP